MWKRFASSVASRPACAGVMAIAAVAALGTLAGCGQKGPLTLPAGDGVATGASTGSAGAAAGGSPDSAGRAASAPAR